MTAEHQDRAEGAVVVFHQRDGVVFERRPAAHEALPRAQEPLDLELRRDHLGDVERVRAEIAEHVARAGELGIDAPSGGRIALLDRSAVEAVRELQVDEANVAELAIRDHRPRLLDHLMSRIAIHDADDLPPRGGDAAKVLRLGDGEAQRLLAHDVKAVFERRLGDLVMRVVGSRDRHGLDTIGAFRFAREQRAIVRIAATFRDAEFDAECASAVRVDVKGARDEVEGAVAQRG